MPRRRQNRGSDVSVKPVAMSTLLEQINSPADLKSLEINQLDRLAAEIREFIIESVSNTGGHLASNLGMVELTLAMHYVFDFSQDKLLWDVGHQCYAHKIVTSRREQFRRLRQADGISGFPNPDESEYDLFRVGHAGTSISTAIGMALGMEHRGIDDKILAVVGDASIVNGTNFEALNNLGLVKRQMLIVLNDNSMAIDATVGALAKYFSRMRLSRTYEDVRKTTSNLLQHLPLIGRSADGAIESIKKGIRMALPESRMFESLNIPYFGPVDGHDIESLIRLFRAMSHVNHPAIFHVHTKKGKGFHPAGKKPSQFHSTGPFKINGHSVEAKTQKKHQTFTDVFGAGLAELGAADARIVAITSAMCDGTGLMEFRKRFPDRFYDVGIAEGAAVDIAAGMARAGLRPVVCIYSTFLQRSFDHIFQEVALQNLPVVFCVDRAGFVGPDGPTHHGLMDIGYLRMMPNMVLTAPADEGEMKLALQFALESDAPVVVRYPKDAVPAQANVRSACGKEFKLGKSVVARRTKEPDITIVSYGCLLEESIEGAKLLSKKGISADVINARFAAPIDDTILDIVAAGGPVLTVEDHFTACGFGSAVLEAAVARCGRTRQDAGGQSTEGLTQLNSIHLSGVGRRFIGRDLRGKQLMESGLNADEIAKAARDMLICLQRK